MITLTTQPDSKSTLDCNKFVMAFDAALQTLSGTDTVFILRFFNNDAIPSGKVFTFFGYEFEVETGATGIGTLVDLTSADGDLNSDNFIAALATFPLFQCAEISKTDNLNNSWDVAITWSPASKKSPDINNYNFDDTYTGGTPNLFIVNRVQGTLPTYPEGLELVFKLVCVDTQNGIDSVEKFLHTPLPLGQDCLLADFCLPVPKSELEPFVSTVRPQKNVPIDRLDEYCKSFKLVYGFIKNKGGSRCGVNYFGITESDVFAVYNMIYCDTYGTKQEYMDNFIWNGTDEICFLTTLPQCVELSLDKCLFWTFNVGSNTGFFNIQLIVSYEDGFVGTFNSSHALLSGGAATINGGPANLFNSMGVSAGLIGMCSYTIQIQDDNGNPVTKKYKVKVCGHGKKTYQVFFLHPKLGSWDSLCFKEEALDIQVTHNEVCKSTDCGGEYNNYGAKVTERLVLSHKDLARSAKGREHLTAFKASNCRYIIDEQGREVDYLAISGTTRILQSDTYLAITTTLIKKDVINTINK